MATVSRRNRIVLIVFAALGAGGIVLGAVFAFLAGDTRVLVVTLEPGAGQPVREQLRAACGSLPGIGVVADRGNPDPSVQGRFPVRFSLAGASASQEAALQWCLSPFDRQIKGSLPER